MIHVIGGGLAGSEASWQAAEQGVPVVLHEMRPVRPTEVHKTDRLAELVCSNSFRGDKLDNAVGLLKEEMRRLGSLVMRAADAHRVPAGAALAVDRERFAQAVTDAIAAHPRITIVREEVARVPVDPSMFPLVIATGPLTSAALSADIAALVGGDHLYFYDAVSPIVLAETIDRGKVFRASRWGRSLRARPSVGPRSRCRAGLQPRRGRPRLRRRRRRRRLPELPDDARGVRGASTPRSTTAESATVHDFEKETFFEGCLPIEVMAHRGADTLRFGPMKPVGLRRPAHRPHAVRGGAAAPGQYRRRPLQPGRLPDPAQMGRAGACPAHDSRARAGRVRALRHRASQHLHQRADGAAADLAGEVARRSVFRRTDLGRGRLRGIGRVRADRRPQRRRRGPRRGAAGAAARNRHRRPGALRVARRPAALPADQHHVRDHAAARRRRRPQPQGGSQGGDQRARAPRARRDG